MDMIHQRLHDEGWWTTPWYFMKMIAWRNIKNEYAEDRYMDENPGLSLVYILHNWFGVQDWGLFGVSTIWGPITPNNGVYIYIYIALDREELNKVSNWNLFTHIICSKWRMSSCCSEEGSRPYKAPTCAPHFEYFSANTRWAPTWTAAEIPPEMEGLGGIGKPRLLRWSTKCWLGCDLLAITSTRGTWYPCWQNTDRRNK